MCFVSSFVINWQFRRIDHNSSHKPVFSSLNNSTCNSHIIKNKNLLAYFMRILNSGVVYKFQAVNPGCPAVLHPAALTAIRQDNSVAFHFWLLRTALTYHWVCYAPVSLPSPQAEFKFWGAKRVFIEARFLFSLYVLIKNFLGTKKYWGAQKIGERCPPIPRPVFTGLVLTRCRIFLQLWTAVLGDRR